MGIPANRPRTINSKAKNFNNNIYISISSVATGSAQPDGSPSRTVGLGSNMLSRHQETIGLGSDILSRRFLGNLSETRWGPVGFYF